jgi:hypothetical protein
MNYFKIIPGIDPERIEVECGRNGRVFLIHTDQGLVVDVYANGSDELVDTMAIWDEDLNNQVDFTDDLSEEEQHKDEPTDEEIEKFKNDWGQTDSEIKSNLELDDDVDDSLLMDDYFWIDNDQIWCNKHASLFTEREQEIANFLIEVLSHID